MRAFLLLCLIILSCLIAGALLAYPAYLLVHPLNPEWAFHRIASRVSLLLLLIMLIWLLRHLGVNNRVTLGYALPRAQFLKQLVLALMLGVIIMCALVLLQQLLDIRQWRDSAQLDATTVTAIVFKGLLSGLVVALIEETLLRGAMHSAIEREAGARSAILLTATLYAALHFLNRTRIPHEAVDPGSGVELLRGVFSTLYDPLALVDSFLALFAVGVLLGLVRWRTGSIAACIGLHAGWVWVIAVTRELTRLDPQAPLAFLVGSYDGIVGWLALAWTTLTILAYWRMRPAPPAGGHADPRNPHCS